PQPGAAAPAPPPEPPPPGSELATDEFSFTLRLLNADGTAPVLDANKQPYGRPVTLTILRPADYVVEPVVKRTVSRRQVQITATVEPKKEPPFTGTSAFTLSFLDPPPGPGERAGLLREGIYRRTLTAAPG